MPVKSLWTAPVLAFLLACTDPVTLSADLGDEESLINVNVSEDASDTP